MQSPGQSMGRRDHEVFAKWPPSNFDSGRSATALVPTHRAQILGIRRLLPQGQLSQAAQGSCGDHPTQWMFEVVKYGGNSERSLRKNFKNSHRNRELILWLDVTAGKEKDCLRRAASLYRAKDLHAARKLLYKAMFAAQVSPFALR